MTGRIYEGLGEQYRGVGCVCVRGGGWSEGKTRQMWVEVGKESW